MYGALCILFFIIYTERFKSESELFGNLEGESVLVYFRLKEIRMITKLQNKLPYSDSSL